MTNNKLISTIPSIEEILQQLPFTVTNYDPDIKNQAIIKTALLLGILFTIINFIWGNQFYPTALSAGLITSSVLGLILGLTRFILKKLCYPRTTITNKEGIQIKTKNRKETLVSWLEIKQISKITIGSKSMVLCKVISQIDSPKLPKRICLTSKIYSIDASVIILEMLRQHFTNCPQDQDF